MIAQCLAKFRKRPAERSDRGFTLVEVLIAMGLSLMLAGVIVAAIITSLNIAGATSDSLKTSVDVRIVSTYLARDAQGAAGTDPNTLQQTVGTGVSVASNDWGGCSQPGTLVARFSWVDHVTVSVQHAITVTWALNGAQLTRLYCEQDAPASGLVTSSLIMGRTLLSAAAQCVPVADCSGSPTSIALTITGKSEKSSYSTTLSASLRPRGQDFPSETSASTVVFLALGDRSTPSPCSTVSLATAKLFVLGDAIVANECGDTAITPDASSIVHPTDGATTLTGNLADPLTGRTPPPATCGAGVNPAPVGIAQGDPTIYPNPVVIATGTSVIFDPGRYVFCQGLTVQTGATVTSSGGVLLYIQGGAVSIDPSASVELTAASTGDQRNILIWMATNANIDIGTGDHITRLGGIIYAPKSALTLTGSSAAAAINVGVLIAKTVSINGIPALRFGPVPTLSLYPDTLLDGMAGQPFDQTLVLAGDGYSQMVNPMWSATGLSPFQIDPFTGEITGTAPCAVSLTPHVRVVDDNGLAVSADYTLNVGSDITLDDPGNYVTGLVPIAAHLVDTCNTPGTTVTIQYSLEGDLDANGDPIWANLPGCVNLTDPYSCTWDTTNTAVFPDGSSYDLQAVVNLFNGKTSTSDTVFGVTIDNTPPVVTLNSPGALPLKGTITLTADASDDSSGIQKVVFEVRPTGANPWPVGEPGMDINCSPTSPDDPANPTLYTCDWDSTVLIPASLGTAPWDIRASAEDLAGNWSTSTVGNQSVNNNQMSISVVNPGAYIRGDTVTITATPYTPDPATVTSLVIQYRQSQSNGNWFTLCTLTAAPWKCTWPTTGVPDKAYDLQATMIDSRALTLTSAIITTNVDNSTFFGVDVQASNGHYRRRRSERSSTSTVSLSAGKIDPIDTLTLKYNNTVDPSSLIAGWDGSTRSIVVRILDGQFLAMATNKKVRVLDFLDFCTSVDTTGMQCSGQGSSSSPGLGKGTGLGYVALNADFVDGWSSSAASRRAAVLYATISVSGATVTVKIGTPNPCPNVSKYMYLYKGTTYCIATSAIVTGSRLDSKTPSKKVHMVWMPSATAKTTAGAKPQASTRPTPETGGLDRDF